MLRNLVIRRQPSIDSKLEAGGALNYLQEAYQFISAEEKSKSANKQKLTAIEKNKLALIYMEMRQDADVRYNLCQKFKIDIENIDVNKTKDQAEANQLLQEM